MALQPTGDSIELCALPPTFSGTPQQFADEMVRRMRIVSATGRGRLVFSDVEPLDSQAVWIRGLEILLFDQASKRFLPIDISASEQKWFWTGSTTPTSTPPLLWLRTASGTTINTPPTTDYGRAIGWYEFTAGVWRPFNSIVNSGTTAQRPAPAIDLEQYYDTDISVLIWFERGQWRTVDGVPGQIIAVAWPTLAEALLRNPGWSLLGAGNASLRGRALSGATRDQDGGNPLTTDANVPPRSVGETFGETQGLTGAAPLTITLPPMVAYYILAKN